MNCFILSNINKLTNALTTMLWKVKGPSCTNQFQNCSKLQGDQCYFLIVMTSSSLSISTSSNSTVDRPSSCGLGAYGSNPYHSRSTTSLMFESATLTPSWLLYSLEWIRWLYYAYIAHSRLRVEQWTQTLSSIIRIFIMFTVHAREMDGEASLWGIQYY